MAVPSIQPSTFRCDLDARIVNDDAVGMIAYAADARKRVPSLPFQARPRTWRRIMYISACGFLLLAAVSAAQSDVAPDEEVVFFNTAARLDTDAKEWIVPIHGWIFEPETDSIRRAAILAALCEALDVDDQHAGEMLFHRRAAAFLVDNERGKRLILRAGNRTMTVGPSHRNGHFTGSVRLSLEEADPLSRPDKFGRRWIELEVVMPDSDKRRFSAKTILVEPAGLSVISDIDDTIKITEVTDHEAMIDNTFLRPYRSVPGMTELYQQWAQRGAVIHFVSASPWQLYEPLTEFMGMEGFPAATFHLKTFYWKDSRFLSLFADPIEYKLGVIEPVMKSFPKRQFILVGDSGEKDPEVYGLLARRYPDQVVLITIRAVDDELPEARRFQTAFEGIPRQRWRVFSKPAELSNVALPPAPSTRPATTTRSP